MKIRTARLKKLKQSLGWMALSLALVLSSSHEVRALETQARPLLDVAVKSSVAAREKVVDFRAKLEIFQNKNAEVSLATLRMAAQDALAAMLKYRSDLESAGNAIQPDDDSFPTLYNFVQFYYGFMDPFYVAAPTRFGPDLGVYLESLPEILAFDARNSALASAILKFQSQEAVSRRRDGAEGSADPVESAEDANALRPHDVRFEVMVTSGGASRLMLNPRELRLLANKALMAFPDEELALKRLTVKAFELLFSEQATMESYLYSDEKDDSVLQSRMSPWLFSLQQDLRSFKKESAYRGFFKQTALKPVLDAVEARVRNPDFQERFYKFIGDLWNAYFDQIISRPIFGKAGSKSEQTPLLTPEKLVGAFVEYEKTFRTSANPFDNLFWISFGLNNDYLTRLRPAQVSSFIVENVRVAEIDILRSFIQKYMLDLSRDCKENCLLPEQEDEINNRIVGFVNSVFNEKSIPDTVVHEFNRHLTDFDTVVSFRRYKLADIFIRAVRWFQDAERKLQLSEGLREIPLKGVVGNGGQKVQLIDASPDPALVMLALEEEPKPSAHMPMPPTEDSKALAPVAVPPLVVQMVQHRVSLIKEATANCSALDQLVMMNPELQPQQARAYAGLNQSMQDSVQLITGAPKGVEELVASARAMAQADGGVIGYLRDLDSRMAVNQAFRWNAFSLRIEKMHERANSEKETRERRVPRDARLVLKNYKLAAKVLRDAGLSNLEEKLENAFRALLADEPSGAEPLLEELEKIKKYVEKRDDFLIAMLVPDEKRDAYLRRLLSKNPAVYRRYISNNMHVLKNQLPGLFMTIDLPNDVKRETGNPKPVRFFDLIARVIGDACDETKSTNAHCENPGALKSALGGTKSRMAWAMQDLEKQVRGSDPFYDGEKPIEALNIQEDARFQRSNLYAFNPKTVVSGGVAGTSGTPGPHMGFILGFLQGSVPKNQAPSEDGFWPQAFKYRDIYPAIADTKADDELKLKRITVASLIGPFLRAALKANRAGVSLLLEPPREGVFSTCNPEDSDWWIARKFNEYRSENGLYKKFSNGWKSLKGAWKGIVGAIPGGDDGKEDYVPSQDQYDAISADTCLDDRVQMLLANEPLTTLLAEVGEEVSGGFAQLKRKSTRFEAVFHSIKEGMVGAQEWSHMLFLGTMLIEFPPMLNQMAMWYMGAASVIDLSVDLGQLSDFGFTYGEARKFANSAFLGKGLASHESTQMAYDSFAQTAQILSGRLAMDAWFYYGIGHGIISMGRMNLQRARYAMRDYFTYPALAAQSFRVLELHQNPNATKADIKKKYLALQMEIASERMKLTGTAGENDNNRAILEETQESIDHAYWFLTGERVGKFPEVKQFYSRVMRSRKRIEKALVKIGAVERSRQGKPLAEQDGKAPTDTTDSVDRPNGADPKDPNSETTGEE
ncbi:MAG: hypothetical protein AB1540_12280 [Bdellovibrionota bacterium]